MFWTLRAAGSGAYVSLSIPHPDQRQEAPKGLPEVCHQKNQGMSFRVPGWRLVSCGGKSERSPEAPRATSNTRGHKGTLPSLLSPKSPAPNHGVACTVTLGSEGGRMALRAMVLIQPLA